MSEQRSIEIGKLPVEQRLSLPSSRTSSVLRLHLSGLRLPGTSGVRASGGR
jgi:hypothetical protein